MEKQNDITAVIRSVITAVEATYGSLGFLSFRLHSVRQNHKENVFIVKYSFIPREKDAGRMYYKAKIDVKTSRLSEIQEIKEEDLSKDDN